MLLIALIAIQTAMDVMLRQPPQRLPQQLLQPQQLLPPRPLQQPQQQQQLFLINV